VEYHSFYYYQKTDITLKQAKKLKERIVDNESVELKVANYKIANEIMIEAEKLGVICEPRDYGE
jgi:hypothetical protein